MYSRLVVIYSRIGCIHGFGGPSNIACIKKLVVFKLSCIQGLACKQGLVVQPVFIIQEFAVFRVERAASPWPTLGIRSCRTFCSDLA